MEWFTITVSESFLENRRLFSYELSVSYIITTIIISYAFIVSRNTCLLSEYGCFLSSRSLCSPIPMIFPISLPIYFHQDKTMPEKTSYISITCISNNLGTTNNNRNLHLLHSPLQNQYHNTYLQQGLKIRFLFKSILFACRLTRYL